MASKLVYLTDVEGDGARLDDFCRRTPGISVDDEGRVEVDDETIFVFGGDAVDRGPDARRIVRTLLDAHTRQPERVVLLAGNRDLNKMRLRAELGADPRPEHLRRIFETTMGARAAFEHRRTELARERGPEGRAAAGVETSQAQVTDDDVVASYLDEVRPDGVTGAYLAACRLAFRWGATLFVHGGITDENLGFVPGKPRVALADVDVDAWIAALTRFYDAEVAAFRAGEPPAAYQALVDYQRPTPGHRVNRESVVYVRTADGENNLELPPRASSDALVRNAVANVVVGHTPNGDSPSIARDPERGLAIIVADNSHARVAGASRIIVHEDGALVAEGTTRLADGSEHAIRFAHGPRATPLPAVLGLRDADTGHLVKGELATGEVLLYKALPGYVVEHLALALDELVRRPLIVPR